LRRRNSGVILAGLLLVASARLDLQIMEWKWIREAWSAFRVEFVLWFSLWLGWRIPVAWVVLARLLRLRSPRPGVGGGERVTPR
jgi:hypothetical protein